MSNDLQKFLNQVANSVDFSIRSAKKREEENETRKFHGVICNIKLSHHRNGLWTLEFVNKTTSVIRVIKITAESFYRAALIVPSDSFPNRPSKGYGEPIANPKYEIILRDIESNGSLTIERELPFYPRNREAWINAQIAMDTETDETFPLKLIKFTQTI